MNSLKINSCNNNIMFRGTKNIHKSAKVIRDITKNNVYAPLAGLGVCAGLGIVLQPGNNPIKLREQAIKYNKKIPDWQKDLLDRIQEMQDNIKTKQDAGEEINSEGLKLPPTPLSKKIEDGRIPDFSEREMDKDIQNELENIDYTPVKMADFKIEAATIKNKQLKKIAETICRKEDLNKSMLHYLRDVDAGLANITDTKILKHLKSELKRLADIDYDTVNYSNPKTGQLEYFFSLSSVGELVDVYNAITGKYSRYKAADISSGNVFQEKSRPAAYIKKFRLYAPQKLEEFLKSLNGEIDKKYLLVADFESSVKTEPLEQILNEKELLDYIYEKYYVSQIPDAQAKKFCKEINRAYGVRVLISNKTRDIRKALSIIKKELGDWTKVSDGKAVLPRILDLSPCDSRYLDGSSAYSNIWGNIHYKGAEINTHNIIRHEIMHINEHSIFAQYSSDPEVVKLIRSIISSKKIITDGKEKEVLDWENCKYREEFLKAGIESDHIGYAYTNKNEFLAVASEGDLSQYSPEFREILIKIGMPEYVFDLPVHDADVKENVAIVQKVLKKHPKAKYDKLVEYVEEVKFQKLSPRERLLSAVFGKIWKEKS